MPLLIGALMLLCCDNDCLCRGPDRSQNNEVSPSSQACESKREEGLFAI
jgi:hypothetical protein